MAVAKKPIQLLGTMAFVTIGTAVPVGKKWRVDLRATNVTNPPAEALADVQILDADDEPNTGPRCNAQRIPAEQTSSSPDLEYGLVLTAGLALQVRASAEDAVAFSLSVIEDVADVA